MKQNYKDRDHFYISRKLVTTVIILLIIGSGLVVLTNTVINLMSASRDYTALVATWNQANQSKCQRLAEYIQFGGQQNRQQFIQARKKERDIRQLINHLFNAKKETRTMFGGFSRIHMEPTRVTNLITAFQYLQNLAVYDHLQASWTMLDTLNQNANQLIASAIQFRSSPQMSANANKKALLQRISHQEKRTAGLTARHLNDVADVSEWINGCSLWITVILGLLLVLAGIVFSVKGWKSINKWEEILKERNYLASFPELNPNPVLQVNRNGTLNYINPAANIYFPDIQDEKVDHPFLKGINSYFEKEDLKEDQRYQQVVKINHCHFLQDVHYIASEDGLHIHAQDITKKMEQEKLIRQSLKEKEVLLSEIHHRVKNNLAVISSLLEIQAMNSTASEKALRESQMRIQSMAMVHEIMYEADSFSRIQFNNYIDRLIKQSCKSFLADSESISIHTQMDNVYLNINQAIPGGLILNELLSNAMEHAFEEGQNGRIAIQLSEQGKNVKLSVKDNGKGLPEDFCLSNMQFTGFTIIQTLVNQLNAKLAIHKNSGAEFNILFLKSDSAGSSNAYL